MKKVFGMVLFILLFAVISACSNEEPVDEQTETTTTGQADEELSAPAEEEAIEETEDEAQRKPHQQLMVMKYFKRVVSLATVLETSTEVKERLMVLKSIRIFRLKKIF